MDTLKADIRQKVSGKSAPFAVFDFDNTCIVNDIGEATLAYLCRNKLLKDKDLIGKKEHGEYHENVFKEYQELYKSGDIKGAYMLNAKMFCGFTEDEAEEVTHAAIVAEGSEIGKTELYGISVAHGLALRPQVIELMIFLRSCGVTIWVVSASAEIAVKAAMKHFGMTAALIGVRSEETGGIITATLQTPMPIIEGKVDCMRMHIHPTENPLLVIDDSTTGLPILETADIKVVVNRDNALTKEAQKRGWYLL